MTERGRFSMANFHLDRGGAIDTHAKLHDKSRELPAYGVLGIDDLTVFFEMAGQAAAVLAELAKIKDHLERAEQLAAWPEELRGLKVCRSAIPSVTGIILDRSSGTAATCAWVIWGTDNTSPQLEFLSDLELVPEPAAAELDEV